jgi:hypothetical protein
MKKFRTAAEVEDHIADLFAPCECGTETVVRCLAHAAAAHVMMTHKVFDANVVLRAANAAIKAINETAAAAARLN